MKTTAKYFFALLVCLTTRAQAFEKAGLFVEAALTNEDGKTTTDYPAPFSDSSGSAAGYGVGARLGIHFLETLFAGFDARYSMPNFIDSSISYDEKAVSTNYATVVGIQMPVAGLRLWGAYIFDGELNPEANANWDVKYQKAAGSRVGVGFHIAVVSLNLEYQTVKYDTATLERSNGIFPPNTSFDSTKLENKSWILSLSFPMEL